ncbi:MAG: beta-carotene 15,15'-dioxygenase, Brp/Blh family [Flavobacteriaceae bacterium]|nr:beta-carotene 15,15'-dioxygenase, Brp/Blh family [Flavobacteriaceae bacterium]
MNQIKLIYYQNFKIYFTFLLLWFSVQFEQVVENFVAYVLVITIGIIHGANDLLILSKSQQKGNSFLKNLTIYVSIIILCIFIFYLQPLIAIVLFIMISAYHFGEEHFSDKISESFIFNTGYYFAYGLLIFSMLFYNTLEEVNLIMNQLADYSFQIKSIEISLLISSIYCLFASVYLYWKKRISVKALLKELFYILLLFLVFKATALILGFAVYFIFWHSLPSILHQVQYLSGHINKKSILFYVKSASIYWLLSIVGMLILYFTVPKIEQLAPILFVILFAVTAPHMWVMHQIKN